MHRCDADGRNVRPISSNNEQDNTPWPLPDGRILYTRWEYVDRSQVDYHHLWVANPDGTAQMIWYGNLHPGMVMIDAKPIPGSDKVVASFSPGHGQREHAGAITVVDPKAGPDDPAFARRDQPGQPVLRSRGRSRRIASWPRQGRRSSSWTAPARSRTIFKLPDADIKAGMHLHEPRPVMPRPRERIIPDRVRPARQRPAGSCWPTSTKAATWPASSAARSRSCSCSKRCPCRSTTPAAWSRSATAARSPSNASSARCPVEPDGSAYMELPALRSSSLSPSTSTTCRSSACKASSPCSRARSTSCVGCHEQRTRTPSNSYDSLTAQALRRRPSRIEPFARRARCLRLPARHPADPRCPLRALPRLREDRGGRPARGRPDPQRRPRTVIQSQLLHDDHFRPLLRWPQPPPQQLRAAHARLIGQPHPQDAGRHAPRRPGQRRARRPGSASGSSRARPTRAHTPRSAAAWSAATPRTR